MVEEETEKTDVAEEDANDTSGREKFHVHWAVDALPAMDHLSLFIDIQLLRGPSRLSIQHRSHGGLLGGTFDDVHAMYSPLSSTIWSLSAITPCVVLKVPEIIALCFPSRFLYRIYHEATLPTTGSLGVWKQATTRESMAISWIGQPTLWTKMTHSKDSSNDSWLL